ncbi:MAG: TonB-dependent receptor, partial [Gammaproteobacteria bacterium]
DIGLRRDTERLSLTASYDFGDYNLAAIVARNSQGANWVRDLDLTDRIGWFSRDPQRLKDESYELRLTGPQDGRFRWLAGINYYEQEFFSSGQGGTAGTGCISFVSAVLTDDPATCLPTTLVFPNSLADADEAEVLGLFAAADFDLNDQWTAIAEFRYQDDTFRKGGGLVREGQPVLEESFTDLLPRLILRYQPSDTTTLFVSYAEGQIAGEFNAFFINADQREREQYLAQDPKVSEALPAEKLEAWEFGWKQTLLDGRVQMNFAAYTNEWSNAKGRSSFAINETCRASDFAASTPGCDPGLGQVVGSPKQIADPNTGELVPFFNTRNILIPGDARIRGLEFETLLRPSDTFTVQASLTYIDSKYKDYEFNFVEPFAGFKQMAGNQTPRQPKWSGNLALTKFFNVAGFDAFVRTDMIYQGRAFVDESNLAYIDDYMLMNLRGGIETDRYRVELFVRNVLNEDAWATGARWTDFSSPFQGTFFTAKQGVAVSPQDKREIGLRFNLRL